MRCVAENRGFWVIINPGPAVTPSLQSSRDVEATGRKQYKPGERLVICPYPFVPLIPSQSLDISTPSQDSCREKHCSFSFSSLTPPPFVPLFLLSASLLSLSLSVPPLLPLYLTAPPQLFLSPSTLPQISLSHSLLSFSLSFSLSILPFSLSVPLLLPPYLTVPPLLSRLHPSLNLSLALSLSPPLSLSGRGCMGD